MTIMSLVNRLLKIQEQFIIQGHDKSVEVYLRGVNDEGGVHYCEIATVTGAKQLVPEVEGRPCVKIGIGKSAL